MKTILVTGSKGFIGSHAVKLLEQENIKVIGIDNEHNSGLNDVKSKEIYYKGDFRDINLLDEIFNKHQIDLVMHFAGLISVPESVEKPELYFEVNHLGIISLLKAMKKNNIKNIIFSSTAATYGNPKKLPIKEDDEQIPINPYGLSKLYAENEIKSSGLKYTIFRYFNVAGSIGQGLGYFPRQKASHLIPLINNVALDEKTSFKIFGNDYNTNDGTCIRDYVHVIDLANAHILAAKKMLEENDYVSEIYNISSGKGYSVKEVYETANKVHNKIIPVEYKERRLGDPGSLTASSEKLEKSLNWKRKYNLEDMIRDDYNARFN